VEDDAMFQQMLKIALGIYGFEVITASHGVDALMQYKTHEGQFGVILTNHGLGFIRSVREMGYQGRIVVMSGRLTVKDLREYEPHAISGFFHKPFEVALLAAMLLQAD
jgi:ActR/RegA family two-component response regulator